MKMYRLLTAILIIFAGIYFTSCDSTEKVIPYGDSILPQSFKVDIPTSLSQEIETANDRLLETNELNGNEIYSHLNSFIHAGEGAADIVEGIFASIATYEINKSMSFTYKSKDDARTKRLNIIENSEYDGQQSEFQLTIIDVDSEDNEDGGKAIRIFWNRTPIKSIALIKPYYINRNNDESWVETTFRIDYSEEPNLDYDAYMTVYITDLPMLLPVEDPYAMKSMKMFAGRKSNIIDVYGNSDHPAATIFSGNTGFNWAFVASGNETSNIAVAEVGLPPGGLDESRREVLLKQYSINNVFKSEIEEVWPGIDESVVASFLQNTDAPGYFNVDGFLRSGKSPWSKYDELEERMDNLNPYNPKEIQDLSIEFK
ncbi:hypothetical protein ACFLU5_05295 [Bacteroidota bacterium]